MKAVFLSGCIVLAGVVAAHADCASELARLDGGVTKDGTDIPLNSGSDVATSPADVHSQQTGGETAAEDAASGRDAAIEKARQAMANGDEAACLSALQGIAPS